MNMMIQNALEDNSPAGGDFDLSSEVIKLMQDLQKWRRHIEVGMKRTGGMYDFNDVVAAVLRQEKHFIDFGDCCVIMQVDAYPQYKSYHVFFGAGTTDALWRIQPQIIEMAKALGCKTISFSGREGWTRTIAGKDGWQHRLSVLQKEVE